MAHALCMLGNKACRHPLVIFDVYGFPTATVVTEKCDNIISCCITGLVNDTQVLKDIGEQRDKI